jgi:putative ABC transport system permease protein
MFKQALRLAWASAKNRRFTLVLTVSSLALSIFLMLAVERLRSQTHESFLQAVSGTDLIVGPRSSPLQLLLYSVFRLGSASHTMSWRSFEAIKSRPEIAFAIPIALGDSHEHFPVLGTNLDYFEHFRYAEQRALNFAQGKAFADTLDGLFEAVIGAQLARSEGYSVGSMLTLAHGHEAQPGTAHDDRPFKVVGVLAATGTPVDRTVHISLPAIEALHADWHGGARMPGLSIPAEQLRKFDLKPKTVTAVLVGLKNRASVFATQRAINNFSGEALTAILPAVTMTELWDLLAVMENALRLISALVFLVSVLGLIAMLMAGLNERRRELAILRSVGASPRVLFGLLSLEALVIMALGGALGVLLLYAASWWAGPALLEHFGLLIEARRLGAEEISVLALIAVAGFVASLLPGWQAYRYSLADGLSPKI